MTTEGLHDFLSARYAEEGADHYPVQPSDRGDFRTLDGGCVPCGIAPPGHCHAQLDLEAKRRIVAYRGPIGLPTDPTVHPWEGRAYLDGGHAAVAAERDRILRLLALPYAAHPDYQQEWAL